MLQSKKHGFWVLQVLQINLWTLLRAKLNLFSAGSAGAGLASWKRWENGWCLGKLPKQLKVKNIVFFSQNLPTSKPQLTEILVKEHRVNHFFGWTATLLLILQSDLERVQGTSWWFGGRNSRIACWRLSGMHVLHRLAGADAKVPGPWSGTIWMSPHDILYKQTHPQNTGSEIGSFP